MPKNITLDAAAIVPLRDALYSSLANSTDVLFATLELPDRETTSRTHAAYMALCVVGGLLDRCGWHAQEPQGTLTVNNAGELRLILDALERELVIEEDKASDARQHNEHASVQAAERRCMALLDALCAVEAEATTAGLIDVKGAAMREDHGPGRRHWTVALDEQEAGMLREALVQYAVDLASMFADVPAGDRRAQLRRLADVTGALDAIGWEAGAGQVELPAHRAVLAAALRAQIADFQGRDTPSETEIALCERLLAIVEGDCDEFR